MTKRTVKNLSDVVLSEETFSYDAAGNLIGGSTETGFVYDTNNRLISIDGEAVSYDADGNMLSMTSGGEERALTYDSANRLLKAGDCEYTYNAEDIRIRNLCGEDETVYTYDTSTKLSRLLVKTTSGATTKYVYGMGLIGEETAGAFKTYHFDYRGSTVAITDSTGAVTDTFQYDTYGKQTARTGTSEVIFGYNGRDGVITDGNSLLYMRARYYSPELRRFINADIIAGEISNAITLNRYAYANGNPVSNVDPFGLSVDNRGNTNWYGAAAHQKITVTTIEEEIDLTFGLDLAKLSHTQTVTTTTTHGTIGEWFGVYAYTDVNVNGYDSNAGVGLDILYALGFDINVKWLGLGATLSLQFEDFDLYANIEIDFFGDSTASVGIINKLENGIEVNDQYALKGNTWAIICTVGLLIGLQLDPNSAPKLIPA